MTQSKGCGLGALALLVSALAFWGTLIYFGGWIAAAIIAIVLVMTLVGLISKSPERDDLPD